jgi:hypothetical protein
MSHHWHIYGSHDQRCSAPYRTLGMANRELLRTTAQMSHAGWVVQVLSHNERDDLTLSFTRLHGDETAVVTLFPCSDMGCTDGIRIARDADAVVARRLPPRVRPLAAV